MRRTTIFLDPAVESELRSLAQREGKPVAVLIREAVAVLLQSKRPRAGRRLSFTAIAQSGLADTAERHEELLWRSIHAPDQVELVAEPGVEPYGAATGSRKRRRSR